MEKRFILFILITFVLMVYYPYFVQKMGWVQPQPVAQNTESPQTATPEKKESKKIATLAPRTFPPPTDPPPSQEETIQIDTPLYRVVLNSRGGRISLWELKKYIDPETHEPIRLYEEHLNGRKSFSIYTGDSQLDERLKKGIYTVEEGRPGLKSQREFEYVAFHYTDPETGWWIQKAFTFSKTDYQVVLDIKTEGFPEGYSVSTGSDFGITNWGDTRGGFIGFIGPITYLNGEMVKNKPSKIEEPIHHEGLIGWTALQDKYFIAALISSQSQKAIVRRANPESQSVDTELVFGPGNATNRITVYAGPKEHDRLSNLGVDLEKTVDFGWFIYGSWAIVRFLAEPLFYILGFFHRFTANYGLAIILLTVCVRFLFIPLSHKSYKSMKGMQVLQPQLKTLQKKFKDDKQRLQKEMLELYQRHKVNPMGGCLPIFLQIPVFVALFNVLYTTIELRQAPFGLWIHDLSTKDPYYVLPILMGISMVVQQKIQPTTLEPMQARLMMLMPVFITFLFVTFPSGLVLYMLTNNVLTIGQQYLTMKYLDPPDVKPDEKPSEEQSPEEPVPVKNKKGSGRKGSRKRKRA